MNRHDISVEKADELFDELSKAKPDLRRVRRLLRGTGIPFEKARLNQLYQVVCGLQGHDFIRTDGKTK